MIKLMHPNSPTFVATACNKVPVLRGQSDMPASEMTDANSWRSFFERAASLRTILVLKCLCFADSRFTLVEQAVDQCGLLKAC